ncbi:hypothetical protein ACVWZ8_004851 [Arthrobacter sp. UYCu723]
MSRMESVEIVSNVRNRLLTGHFMAECLCSHVEPNFAHDFGMSYTIALTKWSF